jgi:hypothetical protein
MRTKTLTTQLPPLPEPEALGMDFDKGWDGVRAYGYTEAQMQAYALQALREAGVWVHPTASSAARA